MTARTIPETVKRRLTVIADPPGPHPRAGEWVEVLSKEEILATLDPQGRYEDLPFMPEMFEFCGQHLRIHKRAHKTCDTICNTGGLRMKNAVHLEGVTCSGAAHAGCGAGCHVFWKYAWLKRVDGTPLWDPIKPEIESELPSCNEPRCNEDSVLRAVHAPDSSASDPRYACQATELLKATEHLPWWDFSQYLEDYTSGNVTVGELLGGGAFVVMRAVINKLGWRFGIQAQLIDLYDRVQSWRGGVPYPRKTGLVPQGQRTPVRYIGLKPGDTVQVRSHGEILETLDSSNRNRGLFFDAEEVPYCGHSFEVQSRVHQIIDERNGRMIRIGGGGAVLLKGTVCKGHYSHRRMFCPRSVSPFWRETWLERLAEGQCDYPTEPPPSAAPSMRVPNIHSPR